LFDAEQYAPAAGLALLAHEEIGKHRILVDLWWEAQMSHLVARRLFTCMSSVSKWMALAVSAAQSKYQLFFTIPGFRPSLEPLGWREYSPPCKG
jgi:hypothetical protein